MNEILDDLVEKLSKETDKSDTIRLIRDYVHGENTLWKVIKTTFTETFEEKNCETFPHTYKCLSEAIAYYQNEILKTITEFNSQHDRQGNYLTDGYSIYYDGFFSENLRMVSTYRAVPWWDGYNAK